MWAAAEGHTEVVELLLKAGANYHATLPDSGFTPLFFAVREGRSDTALALIKAGAKVDETMQPRKPTAKGPGKGMSALVLAVENGHFELALKLVDAGADPNDLHSGFTPLHVLTWVRKPNRGEDDGAPPPLGSGRLSSLQFVRELVKRGADVNAQLTEGKGGPGKFSKVGVTPFFMAASTADIAYMRTLVELGADPKKGNVDGCMPLTVACGVGLGQSAPNEVAGEEPEILEVAQYLIDLGADVNAVDSNGETPMHGAAYKNLPKVIQFLTDKGAKYEVWNHKNKYGWTPLMIAEGLRPGNHKPSVETIDALRRVTPAGALSVEAKADRAAVESSK
jgi:ankyrin repeat protein